MGNCLANKDNKSKVDNDEGIVENKNKNKEVKTKEDFLRELDLVQENKTRITKEYNVLHPPLGRGAFGEVRKAIHKSTSIVRAIKIIYKENSAPQELKRITNEVEILKKLDHPNIIKVYEFFHDTKHFYIVTELCTGLELFDRIIKSHHFSEKKAAETLRQILSAIVYCHSHNIVHRDLKPENILYESNKQDAVLKIIDFGTSRTFDPSKKMAQRLGTPYYIAPEVLEKNYNNKCDVWSCGVILYILLSGQPPFNGRDDVEIMEKVSKGSFSMSGVEFEAISKEAKKLISKLLQQDKDKRITALEAINDPWFDLVLGTQEQDIDTKTLSNLKNFNSKSKLQQAVYYFIVNNMATKEEKNDQIKTFKALDLNGDGQLTKEEINEGFAKKKLQFSEDELQCLFDKLDSNQSGAIDYTEFVVASIDREKLLTRNRIEACFRLFDKDKSGTISKQELNIMFGGNNKIEDGVWVDLIREVDINGDGEIEFSEFKDMLIKMIN